MFATDDRRNSAEERRLIQQLSKDDFGEECLMQQNSMLQLKLDESRKSLHVEREYELYPFYINRYRKLNLMFPFSPFQLLQGKKQFIQNN